MNVICDGQHCYTGWTLMLDKTQDNAGIEFMREHVQLPNITTDDYILSADWEWGEDYYPEEHCMQGFMMVTLGIRAEEYVLRGIDSVLKFNMCGDGVMDKYMWALSPMTSAMISKVWGLKKWRRDGLNAWKAYHQLWFGSDMVG